MYTSKMNKNIKMLMNDERKRRYPKSKKTKKNQGDLSWNSTTKGVNLTI